MEECRVKKVLVLLCLLCLCGCAQNKADLKNSLKQELSALAQAPIANLADNNKPLYRYYIEPSIGRRQSTQTSNIFVLNNQEFVMNLDIASIINTRFYESIMFEKKADNSAMISLSGKYLDFNNLEYRYILSVYDFEDGNYFISLSMEYVNFYAYCGYADIEPLVLSMMKIGKTVDVDTEKVISTYSSKQSSDYVKEKLDLFEKIIPDSGRIEELMGANSEELEINQSVGDDLESNFDDSSSQDESEE